MLIRRDKMLVEHDLKDVRVSDIIGPSVDLGDFPALAAEIQTSFTKLYKTAIRRGTKKLAGLILKNGFPGVISGYSSRLVSIEGEVFPVQNVTEIRKINPEKMRDQFRIDTERQESLSKLISLLGEGKTVVRHRQVIKDGRVASQSDMARLRAAHVSRSLNELIDQGRIERVSPGAFFFHREK